MLAGTREEIYTAEDWIGGEMGGGMWMRQGDYKAVSVAPCWISRFPPFRGWNYAGA